MISWTRYNNCQDNAFIFKVF